MKDVPHHMMKFMRKTAKKALKDNKDNIEVPVDKSEAKDYAKEITSKQNKQRVKRNKQKQREEKAKQPPKLLSIEEKNQKMKKRVPEIRKRSHKTINLSSKK